MLGTFPPPLQAGSTGAARARDCSGRGDSARPSPGPARKARPPSRFVPRAPRRGHARRGLHALSPHALAESRIAIARAGRRLIRIPHASRESTTRWAPPVRIRLATADAASLAGLVRDTHRAVGRGDVELAIGARRRGWLPAARVEIRLRIRVAVTVEVAASVAGRMARRLEAAQRRLRLFAGLVGGGRSPRGEGEPTFAVLAEHEEWCANEAGAID